MVTQPQLPAPVCSNLSEWQNNRTLGALCVLFVSAGHASRVASASSLLHLQSTRDLTSPKNIFTTCQRLVFNPSNRCYGGQRNRLRPRFPGIFDSFLPSMPIDTRGDGQFESSVPGIPKFRIPICETPWASRLRIFLQQVQAPRSKHYPRHRRDNPSCCRNQRKGRLLLDPLLVGR